jgi:TatD DNase family protein
VSASALPDGTGHPEFVDIGANLAHDSFDHDRADVLGRARAVGVKTLVVTGSSRDSSERAADLAAAHPGRLYATAGVHPHHAREYDDEADGWIRELAARPGVVAIGECGLDFFRNFSPPTAQEHAFRRQLGLSIELGMPLFLHQRDAHDRFCAILDEYAGALPPAVAHCFTEGPDALEDYLERGLYIGVTGWICDERRGAALAEAVRHVPLDRIMIETDAPYLLPRDLDPKPASRRNEPMHLPHVAAAVARLRGVTVSELAAHTSANARRFFGLPGESPDVELNR